MQMRRAMHRDAAPAETVRSPQREPFPFISLRLFLIRFTLLAMRYLAIPSHEEMAISRVYHEYTRHSHNDIPDGAIFATQFTLG